MAVVVQLFYNEAKDRRLSDEYIRSKASYEKGKVPDTD